MPVQPSPSAVHTNVPLTNVSVAYMQSQTVFVADKVFPVVPVPNQSNLYYQYIKGDWFRAQAALRAPSSESAGGGWDVSTATYNAAVWAVHKDIDDQVRANADSQFNIDRDATMWVTQNLLIKRDQLFMSSYMKTGVWGKDLTGVAVGPGANQFLRWDVAGSDPIGDIQAQVLRILEATGYRPNKLVIGPYVYKALINHASILDRIKYTQGPAIATNQLLAQLFGVDEVLVTQGVENSGVQGGADSFAFQNGKGALLVYAAPNAGLLQPSGGYIFGWSGLLGAGATGIAISKFRDPKIKSDRIEGEMAFDMKVVSSDVATYFATAVS